MKAKRILDTAIAPALELLPVEMSSPAAVAMLLAIGLQESRFEHRRQIGGPAHGYWQFEPSGVHGVRSHAATFVHVRQALAALDYTAPSDTASCYAAIEHNDILAAVFARLLLWTVPQGLPSPGDPEEGWQQYLFAWRPGKPHRETWDAYFEQGWQLVSEQP